MILSVNEGFVTFALQDGETGCLSVEEYNVFAIKNNMETVEQ